MTYTLRTLVIASLITVSGTSAHTASQPLRNKQFIFGPVRVSPALPRLGAAATLYGGWKLLDRADDAWLSGVRSSMSGSVGGTIMRGGICVAKAALLALLADRVYDYTYTFANYATWPAYAARLLQIQVNEFLVVTSLYNDVIVRVAAVDETTGIVEPWQQLLAAYQEQCERTLAGLMEIGWYVSDEVTVQLLEALRHDFDARETTQLDRFEIMDFVRHDELLYMRLQALYAAFDHVIHAKESKRAADIHGYHHEIRVLHEMFSSLHDTRAVALTDALYHCNRIATVKTTKDVISGVLQYLQWRISNWGSQA